MGAAATSRELEGLRSSGTAPGRGRAARRFADAGPTGALAGGGLIGVGSASCGGRSVSLTPAIDAGSGPSGERSGVEGLMRAAGKSYPTDPC